MHIDNLKGHNAHHQAETVFKAFARALRAALELDPRAAGVIPSTKGSFVKSCEILIKRASLARVNAAQPAQ